MAGPNLTGVPKTEDYLLGRGAIYFASINTSTGKPDAAGFRHLGNAPEMAVAMEVETLEHQSSLQGLKVVDKEVVISQKANITFALDEVNHENLSLFFSGEKGVHTNVAVAGFTKHTMVTGVTLGRWYEIVNSAGERAYDIEAADLVLEEGATTLVLGTDYTLDLEMGMVFLLHNAANIAAGENLSATLTAEATAKAVNEVRGLTQTNVIGALKFVGINPANNDKKEEWQFHQVQLKADGDFSLISDEFTQMGFTAAAERNTLADPDAPVVRIRTVAD